MYRITVPYPLQRFISWAWQGSHGSFISCLSQWCNQWLEWVWLMFECSSTQLNDELWTLLHIFVVESVSVIELVNIMRVHLVHFHPHKSILIMLLQCWACVWLTLCAFTVSIMLWLWVWGLMLYIGHIMIYLALIFFCFLSFHF